jgi:predicted alpha/beta-fold hydrolase
MNRNDLQAISRLRVKEAKALFDAGHSSGAYYLLGYAVECAIKSCIAKQVNKYDFPDRDLAQKAFKHDLTQLLQTAGLWQQLLQDIKSNQNLDNNWAVVKDWKVESRYSASVSKPKARDFYSACTARKHGFLSWLRNYW